MYFYLVDTPRGCGSEVNTGSKLHHRSYYTFLYYALRDSGNNKKKGHRSNLRQERFYYESKIHCYGNDLFCLLGSS